MTAPHCIGIAEYSCAMEIKMTMFVGYNIQVSIWIRTYKFMRYVTKCSVNEYRFVYTVIPVRCIDLYIFICVENGRWVFSVVSRCRTY